MVFDLPGGASFEEGAAFLLAYLTAWIPLTRQVSIHPGARVLVHAAAGGVGSAAVVVARDLGAEVVATAGSEEKLRLPASLGAREAVTYERLAEIAPVDVVFDPVGGQLFADSIGLLRPLGVALAIGFAGGAWPQLDPALLVGRNIGVQGFYLGRLMKRRPDLVREAGLDLLRLWRAGQVRPIVGATYALADVAEAHRLDGIQALDRKGRSRHVRAIVTGGASGLGAAIVSRLREEGLDVDVLDLATGFDVTDEARWDSSARSTSPASTPACSAARPTRRRSRSTSYRRTMTVNVDGVVLGVRRLAHVMPEGGRIVATASLAGLTAMPSDPVYAASKHAVVGFVRSVAPALAARGISINAVCPGIADTPMLTEGAREVFRRAGFPLVAAAEVADAVWLALTSGLSGHAWGVQPGLPPFDFRFPNVPGARTAEGTIVPRRPRCPTRRTASRSPAAYVFRIRRATTMRWTSSGPS